MLNYIWFGMMAIGVGAGIYNGTIDAVTNAAIDMAKLSVEIAIGLIGIMALWLGIMKIAEESGLIRVIAKGLRPIMVRLFPEVPSDHPAIGSIVLNMSANLLGLGNAATPFGLKAMEELQELNDQKDTATNSMVMFLAINTSSVQLILPATVVALMGASVSDIFVTTILATLCSTLAAIVAVKFLENRKRFARVPATKPQVPEEEKSHD
ncbi:MAG: nucleoside recognition domain-containing protein [Woeseiaceae bacterium]